jgi:glycosyltransferase involved in cell wall biosynthesis
VSPGNVGLTAIHSLSFGTPVCTHSNFFNQMPEVEVIEEGVTGCFFEENNIESLDNVISKWVNFPKDRSVIRDNCYQIIDDLYNPYNQLNVIKSLLNE